MFDDNLIDRKLDKCQFACGRVCFYESFHVADGMDEFICVVSDDIFKIIGSLKDIVGIDLFSVNRLNGLEKIKAYKKIDDYFLDLGEVYSGYNFNPNYVNELKKSGDGCFIAQPCGRMDDESVPYPIYFELEMSDVSYGAVALNREKGDGYDLTDKVVIRLNIAKLDKRIGFQLFDIRRNVAHEIQHVFDMYILRDKNFIEADKKQGMTYSWQDLLKTHEHDEMLNQKDRFYINAVLNIITPDEQRARLAELEHVLKIIKDDKSFAKMLFTDKFSNVYPNKIRTTDSQISYLHDYDLINAVATNHTIQSITRINRFRDILSEILELKKTDINSYNRIILFIGYFMLKHSVFKLFGENKNRIKTVLNKISNEFEGFDDIVEIICKEIKESFCHYVALVNGKLLAYKDYFYKFRYVNEVFGCEDDFGNSVVLLID